MLYVFSPVMFRGTIKRMSSLVPVLLTGPGQQRMNQFSPPSPLHSVNELLHRSVIEQIVASAISSHTATNMRCYLGRLRFPAMSRIIANCSPSNDYACGMHIECCWSSSMCRDSLAKVYCVAAVLMFVSGFVCVSVSKWQARCHGCCSETRRSRRWIDDVLR